MLTDRYDCFERIDELGIQIPFISASNLPRTGWTMRHVPNPETVGQHQITCALMVTRFAQKIREIYPETKLQLIQDTLLIHDIAEADPRVGDITPYCGISESDKRKREEAVIREIFGDNTALVELWIDYEDKRTREGMLAKEIDKLQAIEQARAYEDSGLVAPGTTEGFYAYSVTKKRQIYTDFLLKYAIDLYENKPR